MLTENPKETIKNLIDFLEITPTKEQINTAIEFVHPELLTK